MIDEEIFTAVLRGESLERIKNLLTNRNQEEEILSSFYQRGKEKLSLLMVAAIFGYEHLAQFFIDIASNKQQILNQRGRFQSSTKKIFRHATPLCCACDRANFHIARLLLNAQQNSKSSVSYYSTISYAINYGRIDILRFFIENSYFHLGDDNILNYLTVDPLNLAVRCRKKEVVRYMIENGSNVNQVDRETNQTPICNAVARNDIEIVRILKSAGASLHKNIGAGSTPMMIAVNERYWPIVEELFDKNSIETNLQEIERAACWKIDWSNIKTRVETQHVQEFIEIMREVFNWRKRFQKEKTVRPAITAFDHHVECQTIEQFDSICLDEERLLIEILLIQERILDLKTDQSHLNALNNFGDRLFQKKKYQHCIELWIHAFHLSKKFTSPTSLHRFVWLFCAMLRRNETISIEQFLSVASLIFEEPTPELKDVDFKNGVCFFIIALKIMQNSRHQNQDNRLIHKWIFDFCRQQTRTSEGQTILHLAVNADLNHQITFRRQDILPIIQFPSVILTRFILIYCTRWINIDEMDSKYFDTALHVCCRNSHSVEAVECINLLLKANAHLDATNLSDQTAYQLARTLNIRQLFDSTSSQPNKLKCICSCLLAKLNFCSLPSLSNRKDLNSFLMLHGRASKKNN